MRVKSVEIKDFKRFRHLRIELPQKPKLVILAGPNGCGKSSLFEAFNVWHRSRFAGLPQDNSYYVKSGENEATAMYFQQQVSIQLHGAPPTETTLRKQFYIRSAYRNEAQFDVGALSRQISALEEFRFNRMIENDAAVARNYQRLAGQALEDVFANEPAATTIGAFREKVIGDIRASMLRVFPDLQLNDLGNPLETGTFRFDKRASKHFRYLNLSGGEKAAFDLLLDFIVKRRVFDDTVFCIDEPEAHIGTRIQSALLKELVDKLPGDSQLWVATHSVGMMRQAREIDSADPGSVAFLDFSDLDFDEPQVIQPAQPTRRFWERVLHTALDDLSLLVAPSTVIVCEGSPLGSASKNCSFDAECYNTIFEQQFSDTRFLSGGNSTSVQADRLTLVAGIGALVKGCKFSRLIDRDDHSVGDVKKFEADGVRVLGRRHIESYLYDDEILTALCSSVGQSNEAAALLTEKRQAITDSIGRGHQVDDIKSAAGDIYVKAKKRLSLTGCGNDATSFARNTLAPLIAPDTAVYQELRAAVFGK